MELFNWHYCPSILTSHAFVFCFESTCILGEHSNIKVSFVTFKRPILKLQYQLCGLWSHSWLGCLYIMLLFHYWWQEWSSQCVCGGAKVSTIT